MTALNSQPFDIDSPLFKFLVLFESRPVFICLLSCLFTPEMADLSFRDAVMILQLVFYTPALVASILLTVRHGVWRRSGFIYLVLLALVRINGACMMLATILHPYSIVLYTGAGILNSIALSPLLLSTAGLLNRV